MEKEGDPESFLSFDKERQLIASKHWRPDTLDLDRIVAPHDNNLERFSDLLLQLVPFPAGGIRTLSLIGYARTTYAFSFQYDSVFLETLDQWTASASQSTLEDEESFLSIRMDDIINPGTELPGNWSKIKLADVRKAFASDAQLHIFNLAKGVSQSFVQVVANFFQIQTVAFLQPVVVFAKETGVTDDGPLLLSYSFATGDTSPDQAVSSLEDLLSGPGAFTAFPQHN